MVLQTVGWGMDWIYLAKDKYRWRAPANALMNFLFPYNAENFLWVEELLASQERMDLVS